MVLISLETKAPFMSENNLILKYIFLEINVFSENIFSVNIFSRRYIPGIFLLENILHENVCSKSFSEEFSPKKFLVKNS